MEVEIQKRIQQEVGSHLEQVQAKIAELEKLQAQKDADTKAGRKSDPIPPVIFVRAILYLVAPLTFLFVQALVKSAMLGLLGMPDSKSPVPGPLKENELPRFDENGVPLHNPVWQGEKATGAQPLVVAVVDLVWRNENVSLFANSDFSPLIFQSRTNAPCQRSLARSTPI